MNGKDYILQRITYKISSPDTNFPLMDIRQDFCGLASQQAECCIHPGSQSGYINLLLSGFDPSTYYWNLVNTA